MKLSFLMPTTFSDPHYLYPDDADNGQQHHNDKAGEFPPVHTTKINHKVVNKEVFNFSLTLIKGKLTV